MKQGWKIKKLGEVCEINPSKKEANTKLGLDDKVSFLPMEDLGINAYYITPSQERLLSEVLSSYTYFADGDVLLAKVSPCFENGKIGIANNLTNGVGFGSSEYLTFRLGKDVINEFLYFYLQNKTFVKEATKNLTGTSGLRRVPKSFVESCRIPVPPREEQERIVAELDCLSGVIERKREQLRELDALAQSIFYQMFGDPITNEKGWKVKKLGEVANSVNYGTSSPATEGGKYTYIRMNNLTYAGYLDLTDIKNIDVSDNELEKCIVRKGDILFNRTNSKDLVGKTAMFDLDEEMIIAGYIIRVRVNTDVVLPIYVVRYMNTPFMKTYFRNLCKGAVNQANINSKELKAIPILMPSVGLQRKYAEKIEKIEQQKELIKKSISETETLFNARMDYYFN